MDKITGKLKELEVRIGVLEDISGIKSENEGVHVFPVPELMQEMSLKEYKEKHELNKKRILSINNDFFESFTG